MTIKDWLQKFHSRPLLFAAAILLFIWCAFAVVSYRATIEKYESATNQTADLLSMVIRAKDLTMSESLLDTLVSQNGATSAAICENQKPLISANRAQLGCHPGEAITEQTVIQAIPGFRNHILIAKFNLLKGMSPVFNLLAICLIFVCCGFYAIRIAQNRIENDVLRPLINNLLSNEDLKIVELNELRKTIQKATDLESQKAVMLAVQESNRRVAHDIRGPLGALSIALQAGEKGISLTEKAIARINSIAEDLLRDSRERQAMGPAIQLQKFDVVHVVSEIVEEKEIQSPYISIKLAADEKEIFALGNSAEFMRIVSNLIQNSIEAVNAAENPFITVSLSSSGKKMTVSIHDNGCGIPDDMFSKVGNPGFTYGKKNGNGLGISAAKHILSTWGGSLTFNSKLNVGTVVSVTLVKDIAYS